MSSRCWAQRIRRLRKLLRLLLVREYRHGLRLGVAAAIEHTADYIPCEPATILDVGANRGQYALFALHQYPSAELISFEPLPQAAKVLRRVVERRDNTQVYEV